MGAAPCSTSASALKVRLICAMSLLCTASPVRAGVFRSTPCAHSRNAAGIGNPQRNSQLHTDL